MIKSQQQNFSHSKYQNMNKFSSQQAVILFERVANVAIPKKFYTSLLFPKCLFKPLIVIRQLQSAVKDCLQTQKIIQLQSKLNQLIEAEPNNKIAELHVYKSQVELALLKPEVSLETLVNAYKIKAEPLELIRDVHKVLISYMNKQKPELKLKEIILRKPKHDVFANNYIENEAAMYQEQLLSVYLIGGPYLFQGVEEDIVEVEKEPSQQHEEPKQMNSQQKQAQNINTVNNGKQVLQNQKIPPKPENKAKQNIINLERKQPIEQQKIAVPQKSTSQKQNQNISNLQKSPSTKQIDSKQQNKQPISQLQLDTQQQQQPAAQHSSENAPSDELIEYMRQKNLKTDEFLRQYANKKLERRKNTQSQDVQNILKQAEDVKVDQKLDPKLEDQLKQILNSGGSDIGQSVQNQHYDEILQQQTNSAIRQVEQQISDQIQQKSTNQQTIEVANQSKQKVIEDIKQDDLDNDFDSTAGTTKLQKEIQNQNQEFKTVKLEQDTSNQINIDLESNKAKTAKENQQNSKQKEEEFGFEQFDTINLVTDNNGNEVQPNTVVHDEKKVVQEQDNTQNDFDETEEKAYKEELHKSIQLLKSQNKICLDYQNVFEVDKSGEQYLK